MQIVDCIIFIFQFRSLLDDPSENEYAYVYEPMSSKNDFRPRQIVVPEAFRCLEIKPYASSASHKSTHLTQRKGKEVVRGVRGKFF